MKLGMLSIHMLVVAVVLNGPAAAGESPNVSRADYSAALRKIAADTRGKPMAAYEAYVAYLDGTEGLDERMRLDLLRHAIRAGRPEAGAAAMSLGIEVCLRMARSLKLPRHAKPGKTWPSASVCFPLPR